MKIPTPSNAEMNLEETDKGYDVSRRRFFQLAGGIAGAGVLLSPHQSLAETLNFNHSLGSGDSALLNFLYVLQQIESAFYTEALEGQRDSLNNNELASLMTVQKEEAAHTGVLQQMLGSRAVSAFKADFGAVNFGSRESVLKHAAIIEDMVTAGFNGAANLFSDKSYPVALTKMAMAEAGHAAYFRNRLALNSFGDEVISDGLDRALSPVAVLEQAEAYMHVKFDKSNLPNHTNI